MRRIFGELNKTEKTFFRGKSTISPWLIVQGKFETKAQILAMRLAVARLLATMLRLEMFFLFYVIFYGIYLFVQATKLSLNVSSGKFLPINTKVDLRSVSFQSRPREISKLI